MNKTAKTEESSKIIFDHTNQVPPNGDTFKNLLSRGFAIGEKTVNHPGQMTCEFIQIKKKVEGQIYLEFCYHNPALPKDHEEFNKDPRNSWPGFSLRSTSNLKDFYNSKKETLKEFDPTYEHKNYDWAIDNTSQLPGWNFLTFKGDPVKGVSIWMTEFEKRDGGIKKPAPRPSPKNENGAEFIEGTIWTGLSAKEIHNLQEITQGKLEGDRLTLHDGTWIKFIERNSALSAQFRNKKYPYVAVVLSTKSLATFNSIAKPDDSFELDGQTAMRIKLGNEGWDILVVETKN